MKKTIVLLIAIVLTGQLYSQGQLTRNQQDVQQTVIKLFDAISNRDSINLKAIVQLPVCHLLLLLTEADM